MTEFINRSAAIRELSELGVPATITSDLPNFPSDIEALMVYGSRARGDEVSDSDLDLLAIASTARPSIHAGAVSLSFYNLEQLSTGVGTLFGAHLKRDGEVLWDKRGELKQAIDEMGEVDAHRLFARALDMSQLFQNREIDLPRYLSGLLREARYLLRSCLYAEAIAEGSPCFSVREIGVRSGDPHLARLLASRQTGEATTEDFDQCLLRLRHIIGQFPPSKHGSLEAAVVNEWGEPSDLLSMAFMALGVSGTGSDYAEVEKILL